MFELRPVKESPGLYNFLRDLGMDAGRLMHTLSAVTWHQVRAEEQRQRYEDFMGAIIRNPRMRSFPIRAAKHIHIADWHVLGVAATYAPTVGAGIELAVHYKCVWTRADTAIVEHDEKRRVVRIEYLPIHGKGPGAHCHIEFSIATLVQLARDLARPAELWPCSVQFRHAPPPDISEFQAFFNAPIEFRAHRDAVEFDFDMMSIPIATAEPTVGQLALDYLQAAMEYHVPESAGLWFQVSRAIEKHPGEGLPTIGMIARHLGMSERTLQRRLHKSGLAFHDIVDSVQKTRGCNLISTTDLSLTEIAQQLGFSETSAFTRAFKRWSGMSPSLYRKRGACKPATRSETIDAGGSCSPGH